MALGLIKHESLAISRLGTLGGPLFVLTNLPSVKIFLGANEVVNVAITMTLLAMALLRLVVRQWVPLSRAAVSVTIALLVLACATILPELLGIRPYGQSFIGECLRLAQIVVTFSVAATMCGMEDRKTLLSLQVVWSVFCSATFLLGIVDLNESEQRHYNTLATPIALGILIASCGLGERRLVFTLINGGVVFLGVGAMLSLPSRTAMLGIPLLLIAGILLRAVGQSTVVKGISRLVLYSLILALVGAGIIVVAYRLGLRPSQYTAWRVNALTQHGFQGEERLHLYMETLSLLVLQPLGYGLGSYASVSALGPYPHNLILDATFSGGWLVGFGLLLLVSFVILRSIWLFMKGGLPLALILCVFYMVLVFSVSYSWTSSYMLFALLGACLGPPPIQSHKIFALRT